MGILKLIISLVAMAYYFPVPLTSDAKFIGLCILFAGFIAHSDCEVKVTRRETE